MEGIGTALRKRGTIEYRWPEGHDERLPKLAAELVSLQRLQLLKEAIPALSQLALLRNFANPPNLNLPVDESGGGSLGIYITASC
jgi:hypothetical protein